MSESDREFLQLLRDEREIRRVIQLCGRGSDRKDLELMHSCYHEDAYDDHGPFKGPVGEFFEWARPHHERFDSVFHLLGYPNVRVEGEVALAETYCVLFQRAKGDAGDGQLPGQTVTMACRYLDRLDKRDGLWKIAHRVVAYDWIRREWQQDEFSPHPIGADCTRGLRSKDDPLYTLSAATFCE